MFWLSFSVVIRVLVFLLPFLLSFLSFHSFSYLFCHLVVLEFVSGLRFLEGFLGGFWVYFVSTYGTTLLATCFIYKSAVQGIAILLLLRGVQPRLCVSVPS